MKSKKYLFQLKIVLMCIFTIFKTQSDIMFCVLFQSAWAEKESTLKRSEKVLKYRFSQHHIKATKTEAFLSVLWLVSAILVFTIIESEKNKSFNCRPSLFFHPYL